MSEQPDQPDPFDLDPRDGTVWDLPRDAEYDDPDDPASSYRDYGEQEV
jgi:hypothetical protein